MAGQGTSALPKSPMAGQGTSKSVVPKPNLKPATQGAPAAAVKKAAPAAAVKKAAPAAARPKTITPVKKQTAPTRTRLTRYQRDAAVVGPGGRRE
jgi:hypothetical protein